MKAVGDFILTVFKIRSDTYKSDTRGPVWSCMYTECCYLLCSRSSLTIQSCNMHCQSIKIYIYVRQYSNGVVATKVIE